MDTLKIRFSLVFEPNNLNNITEFQAIFKNHFGFYLQENKNMQMFSNYVFNNQQFVIILSNSNIFIEGKDYELVKQEFTWIYKNIISVLGLNIFYMGITGEYNLGLINSALEDKYYFLKKSAGLDNFSYRFSLIEKERFYNNVTFSCNNLISSDVNLNLIQRKPLLVENKGKQLIVAIDLNDKNGFINSKSYLHSEESFEDLISFYEEYLSTGLYAMMEKL